VVGPANVPDGFTNTGTGPLRLTAIHGAAAFDTEWLTEPDPRVGIEAGAVSLRPPGGHKSGRILPRPQNNTATSASQQVTTSTPRAGS
jgi:hypothetical protein